MGLSEQTLRRISEETYLPLLSTKTVLKTYTGDIHIIPVLGACEVEDWYEENNPAFLKAIIVEGNGPNLRGRDWLKGVKLNWSEIFRIYEVDQELGSLLQEYSVKEVFGKDLGTGKGVTAKNTHANKSTQPKYYKARPVPFA